MFSYKRIRWIKNLIFLNEIEANEEYKIICSQNIKKVKQNYNRLCVEGYQKMRPFYM